MGSASCLVNLQQRHDTPSAVRRFILRVVEQPIAPAPADMAATGVLRTLSDGTKVKVRVPRMRACNEPNAKNKPCSGHLKRWYEAGEELKSAYGAGAELYRCERCHTVYLPNPDEVPRTKTLAW